MCHQETAKRQPPWAKLKGTLSSPGETCEYCLPLGSIPGNAKIGPACRIGAEYGTLSQNGYGDYTDLSCIWLICRWRMGQKKELVHCSLGIVDKRDTAAGNAALTRDTPPGKAVLASDVCKSLVKTLAHHRVSVFAWAFLADKRKPYPHSRRPDPTPVLKTRAGWDTAPGKVLCTPFDKRVGKGVATNF